MKNIETGRLGENYAVEYLKKQGYRILGLNFRTRYAELDIIGLKNDILVFFEVKTRQNTDKGQPYESVNSHKIRKIKLGVNYFLLTKKMTNYKLRMDVISIILKNDFSILSLKHFENIGI